MPSDTYTLTISDAAEAIPAAGSVTNAKVAADAAIAYSKLAPLTSGNILVGSASDVATSVNPSGDVDVSNTGVFSIAAGVVVNADINSAAAISISKLAAGTVAGQIIVAGASPTFTPAYTAVSGDATLSGSGVLTIGANAVDSTKLKSDASVDNNRAVTTDHIRSNAVTFAKLEAPAFSGLGVGGVLVGATSAQTYTKVPVSEIFLNSTGTGMLQASTKDAAAAAILPSFGANESKVLGLDLNGNLTWTDPQLGAGNLILSTTTGGTGLTTYTAGDLLYCSSADVLSKRPIGSLGRVLVSDGSFPVWSTVDLSTATAVGTSILSEANGGTGVNDLTQLDTDFGVLNSNTISAEDGDISTTGTGKIGYGTGSGGAVTQITNRTTGVTLDNTNGAITLVSAAGSATFASFTVTNSTVDATDTVIVNQQSGTDLYMIHVTNVSAGTFDITFATTGGTTPEAPVFNFAVIKAVAS